MTTPTRLLAAFLVLVACVEVHADEPGFGERRDVVALDGARAIVDWPADADGRPTTLVVYACPNDNSAEQTLGGQAGPGVDWHYDIQHVLAQVRVVRERDATRRVVLAVIEADGRSWPAWRAARGEPGNATIRANVDRLVALTAARDVALVAHSGGGSFLFGYFEGGDAIPPTVGRIAFLDADYAFDGVRHGPKLKTWLDADPAHALVVVAYDDRRIEIDGKKVLSSPEKGTFGATERVRAWFDANGRPLARGRRDAFDVAADAASQVRIAVRDNPENAIWHTRLVGELNGVIYALRAGMDADAWLSAPRAYEAMIGQPMPTSRPATTMTAAVTRAIAPTLTIPPRPADARGGSAVMASVAALAPAEREAKLHAEVLAGNVPPFLRQLCRVDVSGAGGLRGTAWVTPDVLAVGSDADWVRVPLTPASAQAIADAFGASLPTRKLVDDVWRAADVKLEPVPLVPASEKGADAVPESQRTDARETVRAFVQHHALVEARRAGHALGLLVAGAKKDVVVSNRLNEKPNRVATYGWQHADGKPIQPLTIVHAATYVDYSHGVRLIARAMTVGDEPADLADVLAGARRASLVSDEGAITGRYDAAGD